MTWKLQEEPISKSAGNAQLTTTYKLGGVLDVQNIQQVLTVEISKLNATKVLNNPLSCAQIFLISADVL